jgi:hypothetical protein
MIIFKNSTSKNIESCLCPIQYSCVLYQNPKEMGLKAEQKSWHKWVLLSLTQHWWLLWNFFGFYLIIKANNTGSSFPVIFSRGTNAPSTNSLPKNTGLLCGILVLERRCLSPSQVLVSSLMDSLSLGFGFDTINHGYKSVRIVYLEH